MEPGALSPWLERWGLTADGAAFETHSSRLLPVRRDGAALMLKLSDTPEGRRGAELMRWWAGEGAAAVIAAEGPALLIERAEGPRDLATMAREGQDEAAFGILCATARRLHARPVGDTPPLMPLDRWFDELFAFADANGGIWADCAETARKLVADPQDVVPLHGDLHHGNVLDFGARGWLAIDPHALIGERGFDYANMFSNPDLDDPTPPVAVRPEVFARRVEICITAARLDRRRLLQWIMAHSGLSAAWFAQDASPLIEVNAQIARLAAAAIRE